MKIKLIILYIGIMFSVSAAQAQWVVSDPGNLAQGIVNSTKQVVEATRNGQTMLQNFNETVKIYQQGKEYYDALRKVKNLLRDARKVQQTILMVGDITDIYVTNFRKMLSDPYLRPEELTGIASGYAILLEEAAKVLKDMQTVVNENGLSMNDRERMEVIDLCYHRIYEFRGLTQYYTNKNIGVAYLRAKRQKDAQRILSLYGKPQDRYW